MENCVVTDPTLSLGRKVQQLRREGDTSASPGTTTAHSRFSRNSLVVMSHWSSSLVVVVPI
jgi:hypothetical protein